MNADWQQIGFCAHSVPFSGAGKLELIDSMVGAAGFEPATSTV